MFVIEVQGHHMCFKFRPNQGNLTITKATNSVDETNQTMNVVVENGRRYFNSHNLQT